MQVRESEGYWPGADRMNILNILIFHGLSRPICGGQSRYWNLTSQLAKRDNTVFVLENPDFLDGKDSNIAKVAVYKELRIMHRTLCVLRDLNPSFIREAARILREKEIQLVLISYPSGAFVVKLLSLLLGKKIPLVYDAHNVESEFVAETFANEERYSELERTILPLYVKVLERFVCRHIVDYITSVSSRDKNMFVRTYGVSPARVFVIPTGAEIPTLMDKATKLQTRKRLGIDTAAFVVLFHGIYSHPANKEAFDLITDYIAPKFRSSKRRVCFALCGTNVPKFQKDNIVSFGFVPNLRDYLSIADLAIAPIRHGAGVKVKVFDYISMGLPLITTTKGAEGINLKDGEHAVIVDDVDERFIAAMEHLIDNEGERHRLAANARILAVQEYDWERIGEKMDRLLRELVESRMKSATSGSENIIPRN